MIKRMAVPPLVQRSFDFRIAHQNFESAKALKEEALAAYKEALAPKIGKKVLASFQATIARTVVLDEPKRFEHVVTFVMAIMDTHVKVSVYDPETGTYYVPYQDFTVHNELD